MRHRTTHIVQRETLLTLSLDSTKRCSFLHHVTVAGGLEPEVVHTSSYLLPADNGWFDPIIFTSNGLTASSVVCTALISCTGAKSCICVCKCTRGMMDDFGFILLNRESTLWLTANPDINSHFAFYVISDFSTASRRS